MKVKKELTAEEILKENEAHEASLMANSIRDPLAMVELEAKRLYERILNIKHNGDEDWHPQNDKTIGENLDKAYDRGYEEGKERGHNTGFVKGRKQGQKEGRELLYSELYLNMDNNEFISKFLDGYSKHRINKIQEELGDPPF